MSTQVCSFYSLHRDECPRPGGWVKPWLQTPGPRPLAPLHPGGLRARRGERTVGCKAPAVAMVAAAAGVSAATVALAWARQNWPGTLLHITVGG